jgi:sarcosine oxidase subunit alpha
MADRRIRSHPILDTSQVAKVQFTFNGKPILAREGEVISSALLANGIVVFNRHHRDGAPQGIFCANGQCAQCLVLADGRPVKACITPIAKGMDVRSLEGLPELPDDNSEVEANKIKEYDVDLLVIGAGPAGMSAALELANAGIEIIIVDDKQALGGKLGLQTHNFFGSMKDCYAGMRGMDIGELLGTEIKGLDKVKLWLDSPAVGAFLDGKIGILKQGAYTLVRPKRVLVATGAREKTLAFPGCDLPGVYGAGAFQTLVNRDLVKASTKLFIVGGGNVGLIAAYHALQAGIEVLGIVEALPQCGGYKVHLDKVKRLGIPVWASHTVLRAEGNGKLEKVTIAQVDNAFNPVHGTERTFEADTLLIAVGLSPVNEILSKARQFGFKVYAAGDADVIAEASAAMFSGKIIGRKMLRDMGFEVEIPKEWFQTLEMLRAKPGPIHEIHFDKSMQSEIYPVIRCSQEIPCNPCTAVCPRHSIETSESRMTSLPAFNNECIGCTRCVTICPGLAITLVDRSYDPERKLALVTLPWEMPDGTVWPGRVAKAVGFEGESLGRAKVIALKESGWQNKRKLLLLEVASELADKVAGIQMFDAKEPGSGISLAASEDGDTIVCRCERVTKGEIIRYIKETGITDFNALKAALRVGMGPCGGKTCTDLVMRIFRQVLGRDAKVEQHVERPFTQEVPLSAFVKEEGE